MQRRSGPASWRRRPATPLPAQSRRCVASCQYQLRATIAAVQRTQHGTWKPIFIQVVTIATSDHIAAASYQCPAPLEIAYSKTCSCYALTMITESYYWKKPLLTGAKVIRKHMDSEDVSEAQFAQIEREIFIGFYAIRKLLEATGKVSVETRVMKVALKRYKKRAGQPIVDWYNRSEFWELYDLDKPAQELRDLLYVAHRMVHSYIFILCGDDDGHGAFFTSDRDKDTRLHFIGTDEIVRVFEVVGQDYPSSFHACRDETTGEMKWSVTAKEPDR